MTGRLPNNAPLPVRHSRENVQLAPPSALAREHDGGDDGMVVTSWRELWVTELKWATQWTAREVSPPTVTHDTGKRHASGKSPGPG